MGNHPPPKLPEDPQEKAVQPEPMETTGSPISTAVLTSVSEDSRGQFENSVLQLREQDESEMTVSPGNSSAVDGESTNGTEDIKIQFSRSGSGGGGGGFLEGLFGCLRPVWNIIGKAYSTDYKLQQQGKRGHVYPGKALLGQHSPTPTPTSDWSSLRSAPTVRSGDHPVSVSYRLSESHTWGFLFT